MKLKTDFNFVAFNPAVVDKTDDFFIEIDPIFKVLCIFFLAENNQFFCRALRLLNGLKLWHHKSLCDFGIYKHIDRPIQIIQSVWLYGKPFSFNQCFFLNRQCRISTS